MQTMWKDKMIEQDINYADSAVNEMTFFFETRVENLEPKEEKKKSTAAAKKSKDKKSTKKRKWEASDSNVVVYSADSSVKHRTTKKKKFQELWKEQQRT